MDDKRLSDSTVKFLRSASVICGFLLLLAAVFAQTSGFSVSTGISLNQIGFIAGGLLLAAAGFLGRRFPDCYKAVGVMILNILVALFFLELLSVSVLKVIHGEQVRLTARKIEEGGLETRRTGPSEGIFEPYVMWRANPLCNTDTSSVDQAGYRNTPGSSQSQDARSIFLLGGSAMWGTGVSDSNTVATHLQMIISRESHVPVSICNLAQPAYNSTQELVELMLQVRNGNVPDLVIFYDGFNDIWAAYETGAPGRLFGEAEIASSFHRQPGTVSESQAFIRLLQETNTWMLVAALRHRADDENPVRSGECYASRGVPADSLAEQIVELYLSNITTASVLGEGYGFRVAAVWQPSVWYGAKPLSSHEQDIYNSGIYLAGSCGDSAFFDLYEPAYRLFESKMENSDNLLSFADVFSSEDETVYTDFSGVHLTGSGNRRIAESLFVQIERIAPELLRE